MVILSSKLYQRLGLFASAFILSVSGLIMAAPLYFDQVAHAVSETKVTQVDQSGWYIRTTDIPTGGNAEYAADNNAPLGVGALKLSTNSDVNSIIHVTHDFDIPLNQVNSLSYSTKQLAAFDKTNGNATLRVSLSLNGGTVQDEQLMFEPYYNGFNGGIQTGWQTWNLMAGKFWSNWGNTYNSKGGAGAGGYDTNFTIADVLHDYPSAKVVGLILSMGTYNISQQILVDNVKLNDMTYDFEPSQLAAPTNLTPLNNSYTNNPSFDNTWSAVDGAVKYEYETTYNINGVLQKYPGKSDSDAGNYVLGGTTIVRHNSGAPESTYSWRVRGIDAYGNAGLWSDYYNVTVDTTKPGRPSALSFSTTDGTVLGCNKTISKNAVVAKWNASFDTNFSNYEYKSFNPTTGWVWNGGNIGSVLSRTGALNGGDGTYGFAVRAVDKAGNVSDWTSESLADSCKVTYDATAPVVAITTPFNDDIVKGIVTISGSVKDTNPDHYYLVVENSKGAVVAGPGTVYQPDVKDWSWDTTSFPDGTYTIDLEARDAANNKGSDSTKNIVVTVDNTAPVGGSLTMITKLNPNGITISSPDKDGVYALPDLSMDGADVFESLNIAVTDANLNTDAKPIVYVDGTANGYMQYNALTNVWDYTVQTAVPDFSTGTHDLVATFKDKAGNAKTLTARFMTDNTAPAVAITSPTTYKFSDNATVAIEGTTDDAASYKLFINGELADSGTSFSGYKWNTAGLSSGDYLVRLEAADLAGNIGHSEITITYTAPTLLATPLRAAVITPTATTAPAAAEQPVAAAADTNEKVLGDNTITPNSATNETKGEVKGATDTKTDTTWSILGLAWYWWLLIAAAVGLIVWGIASSVARRQDQ